MGCLAVVGRKEPWPCRPMSWVSVLTTTHCTLLGELLTSLICKIRTSNTPLVSVVVTVGDLC